MASIRGKPHITINAECRSCQHCYTHVPFVSRPTFSASGMAAAAPPPKSSTGRPCHRVLTWFLKFTDAACRTSSGAASAATTCAAGTECQPNMRQCSIRVKAVATASRNGVEVKAADLQDSQAI